MDRTLPQASERGYNATDSEGYRARIETSTRTAEVLASLTAMDNQDWLNVSIWLGTHTQPWGETLNAESILVLNVHL
jgi:hypothetical protein